MTPTERQPHIRPVTGRRGCRVFVVSALLTFASPNLLRAEGEENAASARILFQEGRKLVADGDYAAACSRFEESLLLDPGMGTSFNLADCWEHLDRTASAWARFLDVAAAAKASGQIERERIARDRAAALEPKLHRLIIEISASPGSETMSVERNGKPVGRVSWGLPLPVDPGDHVVVVRAPHKKEWSSRVTVPITAQTVSVSVPELEDAPPDRPSPPLTPPSPPIPGPLTLTNKPAAKRLPGTVIALGAAATAGLAVSALFGLAYREANDQARSICPTAMHCSPEDVNTNYPRKRSEALRDRTIAFAGLGVGTAALAAAALLWWRSPPRTSRAQELHISMRGLVLNDGTPFAASMEVAW